LKKKLENEGGWGIEKKFKKANVLEKEI